MELPESFTTYTKTLMGESLYGDFLASFQQEQPTSIRINRSKWSVNPIAAQVVPWCADGFYLSERPNFTFDPLFHAGCYYVQEAASMFICQALGQYLEDSHPLQVLDMCAAPGGKSTAVQSILPKGSVMICNEPIRQRANILAENMHKWGATNTLVTNNYPADFTRLSLDFDVIICDVPCSGEGMFRKDEGAIGEWSTQNVEKCRVLQRDIVSKAWDMLKPGGLLVYSTCTFNTHEDEENIAWICNEYDAEVLPVDTLTDWGITNSLLPNFEKPVYRFIPGRTQGEGIFMAIIRKGGETGDSLLMTNSRKKDDKKNKKNKRNEKESNLSLKNVLQWINNSDAFVVDEREDIIYAIPLEMVSIYNKVKGKLRLLKAGITIGQIKGKDIIPNQSLALSLALKNEAFPIVELEYQQAIAYLRKEPITLPIETPRGYVIVSYRQKPLGFVKNIGNRSNNLYPMEWKIKSSHIPDACRIL